MVTKFPTLVMTLLLLLMIAGCDKKTEVYKQEKMCDQNWALCALSVSKSEPNSTNKPIKIAVMDTGINNDLLQFKVSVVKEFNTINGSSRTTPKNAHGTMVASIIAATSFKNFTIGINNNVHLYDIQTLDDEAKGNITDTIKGIDWAIEQDVDLINFSYGFSQDHEELRNAIERARDAGILIVAAAGNTLGLSTDYPARYDEVLSISAIDSTNTIYPYAAKGKIDFVAPGVDVPVLNHEGMMEEQSGTSFSTAYATGVISLLLHDQDNDHLIKELSKNSIKLGPMHTYGNGLIQFKEE